MPADIQYSRHSLVTLREGYAGNIDFVIFHKAFDIYIYFEIYFYFYPMTISSTFFYSFLNFHIHLVPLVFCSS